MKLKFEHPTVEIQTPAPGHFVIVGHNPASIMVPDVGHVVPSRECYVSPEVPSDALVAVLNERGQCLIQVTPFDDPEDLAALMYERYCFAVGGKAFNGDPLPTWEEFRADGKKAPQSDAWVTIASMIVDSGNNIDAAVSERDYLRGQIGSLCADHEELTVQYATAIGERDAALKEVATLDEITKENTALASEVQELKKERDALNKQIVNLKKRGGKPADEAKPAADEVSTAEFEEGATK